MPAGGTAQILHGTERVGQVIRGMAITLCLDGAATQHSDSGRYQKHENLSISTRHVELSSTDVTCSYSTPVCFNSGGKIAFVLFLRALLQRRPRTRQGAPLRIVV